MVVKVRGNIVPLNAVLIKSDSVIPNGYSKESTLYDKFLRGTPTSGTNPGGSEGATTHSHTSDGGHVHTSSTTGHTHVMVTGVANQTADRDTLGGLNNMCQSHTHNVTSNSTAPTLNVTSDG